MGFGVRLKQLREERNLSQDELGALVGTSKQVISRYENEQRIPKITVVHEFANALGIPLNYFLNDDDKEEKRPIALEDIATPYKPTQYVPILGRIPAGQPLYAVEFIEGYLPREIHDDEDYFALRVIGDSMNAAQINDGNIVVVRKQPDVDDGDIAVVLVNGEDATVKRVFQNENTVTLMPQSTNPEHVPQIYNVDTPVQILGLVVEVSIKLK